MAPLAARRKPIPIPAWFRKMLAEESVKRGRFENLLKLGYRWDHVACCWRHVDGDALNERKQDDGIR